jgi:hypothetical protein
LLPKRSAKSTRKHKRFGKRTLAILAVLLIVGGIISSFLTYGLSQGAVVNFSFGGKSDVRESYQLVAMSHIQPSTIDITHIILRNTGSAGISVVVTMHTLNAVVSAGYYGPYSAATNIQVDLPPASYRVVIFYLTLPLQVSTFTLRVTVGRVLDFSSITSLAISSLSPIQPTSPTTLVYVQAPFSEIKYELTQQY